MAACSSSGAVRGGAVRGGARPAPDPQWGDYLPGQASAPLAEWSWIGDPGTGSTRGRRPYKKEQKYLIQARKAFLRVYKDLFAEQEAQQNDDDASTDAPC